MLCLFLFFHFFCFYLLFCVAAHVVAEQADMRLGEELVLNLVSAITNISFYAAGAPDADSVTPFSASVELSSFQPTNILHMHRLRITRLLAPLLVHHNEEAIVESARAFGNFSRNQEVGWQRAVGLSFGC